MRKEDAQKALEAFNRAHPTFTESQIVPKFFQNIAKEFQLTCHEDIGFLVVGHLLHSLPYLLRIFSEVGRIVGFVPKGSATPTEVSRTLRSLYAEIFDPCLNKETLQGVDGSQSFEQYLEKLFKDNPKLQLVIADHGGYFAKFRHILEKFKDRIVVILEHTGNGEAKYQRLLTPETPFPVPIISVANTPLKRKENDYIGHSIVLALANVLSGKGLNQEMSLLKKIAMLGFGNMG